MEKVVDICRAGKKETNLKSARQRRGLSQSELAEVAQVLLRTLQQYEQGQRDILKENVSYAVSRAHVLGCSVEEILDYVRLRACLDRDGVEMDSVVRKGSET